MFTASWRRAIDALEKANICLRLWLLKFASYPRSEPPNESSSNVRSQHLLDISFCWSGPLNCCWQDALLPFLVFISHITRSLSDISVSALSGEYKPTSHFIASGSTLWADSPLLGQGIGSKISKSTTMVGKYGEVKWSSVLKNYPHLSYGRLTPPSRWN